VANIDFEYFNARTKVKYREGNRRINGNAHIRIKKDYLQKRRGHIIRDISEKIRLDISKYIFIKSIQDETLVINKRKTEDIILDLQKIDKIIPRDNSYDYLLNMSIQSLTEERMKKLMDSIKSQKAELDKIKSQSIEDLWLEELK
jgi:DNA topoisomerase-2